MKITLNNPVSIIQRPAEVLNISSFTIQRIKDLPAAKEVHVKIKELSEELLIPEISGENYDTAPDWTNNSIELWVTNWLESHNQ